MKASRLFNLLILLSENRKMSSTELSEKLEVSARTIYRDVDVLAQTGIPIYTTTGKQGGIHLMDGFIFDKSMFSDDEQQEIMNFLQSLRYVPGMDVEMLRTKFAQIFNKRTADKDDWLEIDFSSWLSNASQNKLITTIKECIQNAKMMEIHYINQIGKISVRKIAPVKIIFKTNSWYLYAHCYLKKDYRWFKLSRIIDFQKLAISFNSEQFHAPFTTEEHNYEPNQFQTKIRLELQFSINKAHLVYDYFSHDSIFINHDAHSIRVSTDWLLDESTYTLLMSFGENVTVLHPLELKTELMERHKKALQRLLDSQ